MDTYERVCKTTMSNNMTKHDPDCPDCHGKGFFMQDDLFGEYREYECDCEE